MVPSSELSKAVIALALILAASSAAAAPSEIPAQFRGTGCNLKYTYTRTPKGDAIDCFEAKAGRKDGDAHNNDNFIRITADGVAGVEWGCKAKSVTQADGNALTFAGACGDEGSEFAGTVTLLLRPGRLVIVDQEVEGRHMIDIYRLRDDLK
jgi:hypothetical protein